MTGMTHLIQVVDHLKQTKEIQGDQNMSFTVQKQSLATPLPIPWKAAAYSPSDKHVLTDQGVDASAQVAESHAVRLVIEHNIKKKSDSSSHFLRLMVRLQWHSYLVS